jgi:basic amino acid/polyamine antiporter, APA family
VAVIASFVRDPEYTIPGAIFISFPISAVLFLAIGTVTLGTLGAQAMSDETMALPKAFVQAVGEHWVWAVAIAAMLATTTTIAAGDSQVAREMGRAGELPHWFGAVHGKEKTPRNAILALGLGVAAVTFLFDLRPLIDVANVFSLIWYGAVNYAGVKLSDQQRFASRGISWFGIAGCAVLLFTLPLWAIALATAIMIATAVARRQLR